jgi:peptide chain release factor 1
MLIQRSEDAKNVMVKFVLEQVGMKRVFCRGFVPYVYQICENQGWRTSVVDMNEGTSGGFKEVIFEVAKMFMEL